MSVRALVVKYITYQIESAYTQKVHAEQHEF